MLNVATLTYRTIRLLVYSPVRDEGERTDEDEQETTIAEAGDNTGGNTVVLGRDFILAPSILQACRDSREVGLKSYQ